MMKKEKTSNPVVVENSDLLSAGFFSKITHELRTPIHGLQGIASFLDENWEKIDESTKEKCILNIADSTKILGNIANSLITNFENENDSMNFVFVESDLINLVSEVIDQCQLVAAFNNEIAIDFESELESCLAEVDVFWFKTLLSNLLINAIKFSTAEGGILVSLKQVLYKGEIAFLFLVSDQGVGIAGSELKKIFKPYARGSKNDQQILGVGLGLAICTEVVSGHGGKITAKNNHNGGATIEFTIPKRRVR